MIDDGLKDVHGFLYLVYLPCHYQIISLKLNFPTFDHYHYWTGPVYRVLQANIMILCKLMFAYEIG